jgi:3-hydroxyisobutyrate dehydrogenase
MDTAGVVGVGSMGSVFVERFVAAGVPTLAYDVSAEAVKRVEGLGARGCASPAELARASDVVDVMVRTDAQMLDCVLGDAGVLEGLASGKYLVLHSTVHPSTTRTIAEAAGAKGIFIADACIGGRPEILRAGKASVIVGGEPDVVERLRPHLARLGTVYPVGPIGSGNTAKMLHNVVLGAHRMILSEALRIGLAAGVPPAGLLAMFGHERAPWDQPVDSFDYEPGITFNRNLIEQVLPPLEKLADEVGADVPIMRLLIERAKHAEVPRPA